MAVAGGCYAVGVPFLFWKWKAKLFAITGITGRVFSGEGAGAAAWMSKAAVGC